MDSLNEIAKSLGNSDGVYIIVGIALFLIAITIVRKIIAIASFVFIGLCIFALVKGGVLTSHEASTGSDGNSSYISQKVDAVKKTYLILLPCCKSKQSQGFENLKFFDESIIIQQNSKKVELFFIVTT